MPELEKAYLENMSNVLARVQEIGRADLVVGIPFLFDPEKKDILTTVKTGMINYYPELSVVTACFAGTLSGPRIVSFNYQEKGLLHRGWVTRGFMDLARVLDADLLLLEPALFTGPGERAAGLTPDWLKLLYEPILGGHASLVLPRFKSSLLSDSIADHFVFPLLGALYNLELRACLGAGMAMSRNLLTYCLAEAKSWPKEALDCAIDEWLLTMVLEQGAEVAEVFIGQKPRVVLPVSPDYLFSRVVHVLFQAIAKKPSLQSWRNRPAALRSALSFGTRKSYYLEPFHRGKASYIQNFRRGASRFYTAIWKRIFPEELTTRLWELAHQSEKNFIFPAALWTQVVYLSLLAYIFASELNREDIAASLRPLFEGRLAGFLNEISTDEACSRFAGSPVDVCCPFSARDKIDMQMEAFIARKQYFLDRWFHRQKRLQPFLPEIAYWEYIPGIPIVLPLLIKSPAGDTEHVSAIYEQLLKEYKEEFEKFVEENLGLTAKDGAGKIGNEMRKLLFQAEEDLEELLLPGDIHTLSGMRSVADQIFKLVSPVRSFSLHAEVAEDLLRKFPPRNLMTKWNYEDVDTLLQEHDPLDVLALTSWSEESRYIARNNDWFRENLQVEHFALSPVEPLVVDYKEFPALSSIKEAPMLNFLASRVVVSTLRRGSGGDLPKIRLLTTILKGIIDAEQFGLIWETFAQKRREFKTMVLNSIEGHWGMSTFSAHSIFENRQQYLLKERLAQLAQNYEQSGDKNIASAGALLGRLVKAYHLGLTLPDGQFITASLWSWASYSFKGGKGFPTPLSLMIERRWFSSELFFRCYEKIGGQREEIFPKIIEFMGQGKETEDLAELYLGAPGSGQKVILDQKLDKELPPAGKLVRSYINPILAPIKEHDWESKYVLNCGAIRIEGKVYLFYRAVGEDGISRIGLAVSGSGLQVDERLPEPVFTPGDKSEKMGCEDPRLVVIDGRVYMLYTAYDGSTPQIALASIAVNDLTDYCWERWKRHGLVFPNFPNKDAILFPERFNGKLAMYHRINPNIWVAFADNFDTPWPREGHKIVLGTRSGMMWDAVKIGAGAQPLKTRYGWLLIYHGVDYSFCYRLGVFLTSLVNPAEVLYRSPNPILEPETSYEVGVSGQSWVPNVVFTCGAVPLGDKEILADDDEVLVYYGGADTVIGVARATIAELLPARFRQ